MNLADKVIACRKYKGYTRAKTCEVLNITLEQLMGIESRVFKSYNTLKYIDPEVQADLMKKYKYSKKLGFEVKEEDDAADFELA